MNKRFSRELFDKYDEAARAAGRAYLAEQPEVERIWDNEERYGCDLLYTLFDDPTTRLLECEVKDVWKGGPFPYPDINVLFRKKKYWDIGADLLLLAGNFKDFLILTATKILASPVETRYNKYVPNGEMMFVVKTGDAIYGSLEERPHKAKAL